MSDRIDGQRYSTKMMHEDTEKLNLSVFINVLFSLCKWHYMAINPVTSL